MFEPNTLINRRTLLSGLLSGATLLILPGIAHAHDVKDPVCRMSVDSDTTPFTHKIGGKTFYFCSTTCRNKFITSPAKYTKLAAELEESAGSTYVARVSPTMPAVAGKPTVLNIRILNDTTKKTVKDFELTHEKKMHFLMVSEDMAWFSHEHPDLGSDGIFRLRTTFPRPGRYHLYADCTPADGDNQILPMVLTVGGKGIPIAAASTARPLIPDTMFTRRVGDITVTVAVQPKSLRREQPAILTYTLRDAKGHPLQDMEPYLGAMGHLMAIRQDGQEIVHTHALHPVAPGTKITEEGGLHLTQEMSTANGPTFSFKVTLPTSGIYKIWAQFQRRGKVITVPFTFRIADIWDAAPAAAVKSPVQKATIQVDNGTYSPANLTVTAGKPVELTFVGGKAMGCGDTLVFPGLGIKKTLTPGAKTVVTFTPKQNGQLRFTCAMNMYQGQITVNPAQ
jgi:YHS domain-containing protein/plastocyanin